MNTAEDAQEATPRALAEFSTACVVARLEARRKPGKWASPQPAGYQRQLAWRIRADGAEEVLLHREHLRPYDYDDECLVRCLPAGMVILEREEQPRDSGGAVLYRIGPPPPEPEPDADEVYA